MPVGITREIAAHHEAGHAVVALVCDVPVRYASIKPLKKTLGRVAYGADDPILTMIISLAGPQAQRRFAPRSDWFGHGDMVLVQDMILGKRSKLTEAGKDTLLEFVADHAIMFVDYFWADIKAVAKALLKRETLTGDDEILDVIRTARRQSGRRGRVGRSRSRIGDPDKFFLSAPKG
jgi:hypothetical protein